MNRQSKAPGKGGDNHASRGEKDAPATTTKDASQPRSATSTSSSEPVSSVDKSKADCSDDSERNRMSQPESTDTSTSKSTKPEPDSDSKQAKDDGVDSLDASLSKLKLDSHDKEKPSPPQLGTTVLEFVKIDPSFTTPKLRAAIQERVTGSFKLNWISKDKTRVNFDSIDDAVAILNLMKSSTEVKVTPYTPPEDTAPAEKKMAPRGSNVSRLTGKPKPATSDAVARRLIVGHLGLKTKPDP